MDPMLLCPGKGLVLPTTLTIDQIASHTRFFILSLPNGETSQKSLFAIQKALQGINEPKSDKKLRSGDLLLETKSAAQSKCYLTAKIFLDFPLQVAPHRSLKTSRGVIPESEILEGFSDQGVIQVRRITIKFPTRHLILTFNNPNLPTSMKAGYLNCKIRPYISNPALSVRVIVVKKFAAQKLPLRPRKKKRSSKTIRKDIEIKMTPYKPKKSTPVQDTFDEEDMLVYDIEQEEAKYGILTPTRIHK
ncbi:putative RNA-directed DNA polymerase from transposon BS [Trichonephila clavipes]|uniref:Putative RNA-directed DNA polymerase from transposon BS n=1 Tax=Trichonephila clavipes TaxID=2585209 RepID=A0A8X6RPW4_TRICX|nr:putative RNA-directed DNA polymerase from transposon BS [Trichonephila clavipes]